jgi:hypothetical protein
VTLSKSPTPIQLRTHLSLRRFDHLCIANAILIFIVCPALQAQQAQTKTQSRDISVEILQVIELPMNVHDSALVKTEKGYLLRCRFSSNSDTQITGLRYSLTAIDPVTGARPVTNRIEGVDLAAYGTKTITFSTPVKFKPKDGMRVVLMVEQVVSAYSIWEVVKAKDVLEAYVKGDYSIQPHVLRVANQVDAPPPQTRVIYKK